MADFGNHTASSNFSNSAINNGDNNQTVQFGTGMRNNSSGDANLVGQVGRENWNQINGNMNYTYQDGNDNQASMCADKSRIAQFGTHINEVTPWAREPIIQGIPYDGWSWNNFKRMFREAYIMFPSYEPVVWGFGLFWEWLNGMFT